MPDTTRKNFFLTRTALALLPLLLMGAGVWYFIQGRGPGGAREEQAPVTSEIFGGKHDAPEAPPREGSGEGFSAARIPEAYDSRAGIDIQGSPAFKRQITSALKLIWSADRKTFFFIKRSLCVIRNEDKTGFYMENRVPVAAISNANAFRSVTWCAGIIAHQAWHGAYALSQNKKKAGQAPPPPGENSGLAVEANPMRVDYKGIDAILYVEDKAFTLQLDVLKKVGAPARETRPLFRRAPRDFFLAHDGSYSLNP